MSKTFNKNIPYTFTGSIILPTSSNLNITSNSNTIGNMFTTGGNVGIGTTSPSSLFDINGYGFSRVFAGSAFALNLQNFSNTTTRMAIGSSSTGGNQSNVFELYQYGLPGLTNQAGIRLSVSSGNSYNMMSYISGNGSLMPINLGHNSIPYLTLQTEGNVGIRTTSPTSSLDVLSLSTGRFPIISRFLAPNTTGGSSQSPRIVVGVDETDSISMSYYKVGTTSANNYIGWGHNNVADGQMVLTRAGNVGIGTGSPRRTLEIVGGITTDWNSGNRFIGMEYLDGTEYKMGMNMAGATRNLTMIAQSGDSTGNILFSTGSTPTERMRITPAGYVSIGTTAAQSNFTTTLNGGVHISGASGSLDNGTYGYCQIVLNDTDIAARSHLTLIRNGYSVAFFKVNTSNQLVINMGGGGVYLGSGATSWAAVSDRTMKTDFEDIVAPLDKLSQIKGTYYRYLTDASDVKRVGVIAQDVQAVLPEAVSEDVEGILGVSYTEIIPLAIEAIKELKTKNNELQTYIQALETRLTKLEQQ